MNDTAQQYEDKQETLQRPGFISEPFVLGERHRVEVKLIDERANVLAPAPAPEARS